MRALVIGIAIASLGGPVASQVVEKTGKGEGTRPEAAFLLEFRPDVTRTLEVRYSKDMRWEITPTRTGELHMDMVLRWRFAKQAANRWLATGTYESIQYRGNGTWDKAVWKHDVAWNRRRGYRRGKGSEADKSWITPAIRDGVRFLVDHRGACSSTRGVVALGNRHGQLASAMLGFGAILPGKRVTTDDTWRWTGRHVESETGPQMHADARLASVLDVGKRVRVECEITEVARRTKVRAKSSLLYVIADGLPRTSRFGQDSPSRSIVVETRARWLPVRREAKGGDKRDEKRVEKRTEKRTDK